MFDIHPGDNYCSSAPTSTADSVCMWSKSLNQGEKKLIDDNKLSPQGTEFARLQVKLVAILLSKGSLSSEEESTFEQKFIVYNRKMPTSHLFKLEPQEDEDKLYAISDEMSESEQKELKGKRKAAISHRLEQLCKDILVQGKEYAKNGEKDDEGYRLITKLAALGFKFSSSNDGDNSPESLSDADIRYVLTEVNNIESDYLIDMALGSMVLWLQHPSLNLPQIIPDKLENRAKRIFGHNLPSMAPPSMNPPEYKIFLAETLLPWIGKGKIGETTTVATKFLSEWLYPIPGVKLDSESHISLFKNFTPAELAKPSILGSDNQYITPLLSALDSEAAVPEGYKKMGRTLQPVIDFLISQPDKKQFFAKHEGGTALHFAIKHHLDQSILPLIENMNPEHLAICDDFDDGTTPRVGRTAFECYLMGYGQNQDPNKRAIVKAMIEKMPIEQLFESTIPIQTKQLKDEI
ncbi:hypothetical protein [Candidatus Regiella insecticola]|uniref:Uncharacterized protein n=1 Tax=Candidatus Regiella insecticola TaxID=138073 RepID=A0A6L2ZNE2_9ENTR|nr:hypothetical protein [Candidatus Regiella insecticola]GFN45930.1 hypothetical protein RINTU1_13160 [Candidatus Regiella insecticola]